jgi:hypothetical protein
MLNYTTEELSEALQVIASTIAKCEKSQLKFKEGTSQHTLLRNRIKALYIANALITNEDIIDKYTREELMESLRPIASIISKCEKAQAKYEQGTTNYNRFNTMINAMYISKAYVENEISKFISMDGSL